MYYDPTASADKDIKVALTGVVALQFEEVADDRQTFRTGDSVN